MKDGQSPETRALTSYMLTAKPEGETGLWTHNAETADDFRRKGRQVDEHVHQGVTIYHVHIPEPDAPDQ